MAKLRKGLIVSSLTALLAPAAFGGMLAGANAMAANNEDAMAMATAAPKPVLVAFRPHTKLATLGRASAVAWISAGHLWR